MNKEIIITEKTTVRDFTDTIAQLFPGFDLTVKDRDYEKADDAVLLKDLFVFKRDLPLKVETGIEFDDTFIRLVTKTGLNMSYAYLGKHELASYDLNGETTILEIKEIFAKHFPLFEPVFYLDEKLLEPYLKLKEVFVRDYRFVIYDQYSSTRRHFSADTGIKIID